MVNAIVLAGTDQEKDKLIYGRNKALLEINGHCIVEYVVDALKNSKNIDDITLIGPKTELEARMNGCAIVQENSSFLGNCLSAYEEARKKSNAERVFFSCCDIPLITPAAIDDFFDKCNSIKADFYFPIVSKETMKNYSELKKPYMHLIEGDYRPGYFAVVNGDKIKNKKLIEKAFNARKLSKFVSNARLAMLIGPAFILRYYVARDVSLKDVENLVSSKMGLDFKFVESKYPEASLEIDEEKDYLFLNQHQLYVY